MNTWSNFYFLRHGQTDWNLQGRFQGTVDIPLNQTGVEQASKAAELLLDCQLTRIVSSPLVRALKTAEVVAERLAVSIDVEEQLIERHFGPLEGLVVKEVKQKIGIPASVPMAAYLPPEAEQWPDTVARTRSAIGNWLERHPQERILFVAHHGMFAALTESLIGVRQEGENAIPYEFTRQDAAWSVRKL